MIMGVLNVTPDSFSDSGKFFDADSAVAHGIKMVAEGAQIVDVGGESTRPGAEPVAAEEELRRVIPVIKKLRAKIDPSSVAAATSGAAGIFISIDTSKSEVAGAALDAGASIINDVTAGRGDEKMLPLAAQRKAAIVLMHMQGEPRTMQKNPHYGNVVAEVADFFRQQYARALECGVDPMAIAFDPGIGFGKTLEHNLELLKNLQRLRVQDRPLVVGISRKSFLEELSGASDMDDRLAPTIALTSLLRARGASVFRVHDVKENVAALRATERLLP
jgi:dihydropteroate synthase